MGKLAKVLENLFFGSVGGTKTIMMAITEAPDDLIVIQKLAKASRQPLRYIANIDFTNPFPTTNSTSINDFSSSNPVWTRTAEGTYRGTLAGAFTGLIIPRTYIVGATYLVGVSKVSDNEIQVITYESGVPVDDIVANYDLVVEMLQLIT